MWIVSRKYCAKANAGFEQAQTTDFQNTFGAIYEHDETDVEWPEVGDQLPDVQIECGVLSTQYSKVLILACT